MPLLGSCQRSVKKEAAPKPRKKQPRPVSMADLVEGQSESGRARIFGTTGDEIRINFMRMVQRLENGCWNWAGSINKSKGYGVASFGKGRGFLAHRVSRILFTGNIPDGMLVLHTCDNRRCVNPDHFFLGIDRDNARDSMIKLRKPSKLKASDIPEIRRLYFERGLSQQAIAGMFGVTQSNVCCVLTGKTWRHVK